MRDEERFEKDGEEISVKICTNLVKDNGLENIFDVQRYSTFRWLTKLTTLVCQFIDKCSRYKKDPNNIRATWYAEKSKKIFAEKINTG